MFMMIESPTWDKISVYIAENKIKAALEAASLQTDMAVEANVELENNMALTANSSTNGNLPEMQRLDCIYDEEPLGFEKDFSGSNYKMQAQDPLQEIDIGDGSVKRPTYISTNIDPSLKVKLVELLKEYKD
jgi:hypothetical protein